MDRIDEIKARHEAALYREWTVATHQEYYGQGYGETTFFVDMGEGALLKIGVADDSESFARLCALSAFIANAREDIPFLLVEIERLTEANKRMIEHGLSDKTKIDVLTAERDAAAKAVQELHEIATEFADEAQESDAGKDMVEVVRCKDCGMGKILDITETVIYEYMNGTAMSAMDFCSIGEAREPDGIKSLYKNSICGTTHLPCGGCAPVCACRREPEGR